MMQLPNALIISENKLLSFHLTEKLTGKLSNIHVIASAKGNEERIKNANYLFVNSQNEEEKVLSLISNNQKVIWLLGNPKDTDKLAAKNQTLLLYGYLEDEIIDALKSKNVDCYADSKIVITKLDSLVDTALGLMFGFGSKLEEVGYICPSNSFTSIKLKTSKIPWNKNELISNEFLSKIINEINTNPVEDVQVVHHVERKKHVYPKFPKITKPKFIKIKPNDTVLAVIACFIWLFVLPIASTIFSSILFYMSLKSIGYSPNLSKAFLSLGNTSVSVSSPTVKLLAKVPFVGNFYDQINDLDNVLKNAGLLANSSQNTKSLGKIILSSMLEEKEYNLPGLSKSLAINLSEIYENASFISNKIEKISIIPSNYKSKVSVLSADLKSIEAASRISKELPSILGWDKPQTYLILFQNNMELRPTGGFIGSFALVTFEKGKLTNIEMFDSYEADGQLKGYVKAPIPLEKYLGVNQWYLRDSNWDPDFSITSDRVMWFLEKTIDRQVDGVIAIDTDTIKSILEATGPVVLKNNETISSNNLYGKLQYEVEKDFFPGSHKKSNLLSELSESLLSKIKNLNSTQEISLLKAISSNLDSKHIQLNLKNTNVQKILNDASWTGSLVSSLCNSNCLSLWFGEVEANLGVNKVNYFIERSMSANIVLARNEITTDVSISLVNNAPKEMGEAGNYKNYIRLFSDETALYKSVILEKNGQREELIPDISTQQDTKSSSAGIFVNLLAKEKAKITFRFTKPIPSSWDTNEVDVFWRKQAGTKSDPVNIKISAVEGLSLTQEGTSVYNTNLSEDLSYKLFLKK